MIDYLASWTRVKLNDRLGQRGAELVEYAIVLACVIAVGLYFYAAKGKYTNNGGTATNGLEAVLNKLWNTVNSAIQLKNN